MGETPGAKSDNGDRASAPVLCAEDGHDPRTLLSRLGLLPRSGSEPVVVVCGGAGELDDKVLAFATEVLGPAVARSAELAHAVVVDGGLASGVMAVMGDARASRPGAMPVLLGVTPAGKVTLPDRPGGDRMLLDRHHSHVILANTVGGGGEASPLIDVVTTLADGAPVVMVLAGGGEVARAQVEAGVRHGWPVFVIEGTGGLAERIADQWHSAHASHGKPLGRAPLRRLRGEQAVPSSAAAAGPEEVLRDGDIRPFADGEPMGLARQLAWELQEEPVLKGAWHTFATYDHLAARMRAAFQRFQISILVLGVVAILLALIDSETGGRTLHWVVIAIPISVSVLIAWSSRRADGHRWLMLRAAAEAVKAEIYRYRTRTTVYQHKQPEGRTSARRRMQMLEAHLDEIDTRLVRSEASSAPLTPYAGPLPPQMYGANRNDDGLSPLDAERYLQIRVGDQISYYHRRIRRLYRLRTVLELLAISAGGTGAILAAIGLDVWIGLTGGMSTAALAYLGYLQVDNSIVAYNRAASNLAGLERRWRAHGPHRRGAAASDDLVTEVEAVLVHERSGWVHQMSEALQDLKAGQEAAADRIAPADPQSRPGPPPGPGGGAVP